MRQRLLLAALLAGLASCTYYNGMYNARRLAGEARRAERDGRAFEANRLWGLAATKAESVLSQHPRSKYVPEARLIQATALERSGDCESAAPLASRSLAASRETRVVEDAALLVGRCYERLDDPASALDAYDRLLNSSDPDRRMEASYRHGRALRELGRYDEALADLSGSQHPRARGERGAALMGAGRVTEGLAVVDSMLAAKDSLAPWGDLLELYGRQDPAAASTLTMRLARDPTFQQADRVDWVVADAERLAAVDAVGATALLAVAESLGGGRTPATRRAELTLATAEMSRVRTLAELSPVMDRLSDIRERGGPSAPLAGRMMEAAQLVLNAADTTQRDKPQSDIRLFYAAEIARDSLRADPLALGLLRDLITDWPDSPYAPKAALAMELVGAPESDSLRDGVLAHNAASPYVLALRGDDAPGYRQLEDSLRIFMMQYRNATARPKSLKPGRPGAGAKPTPREPAIEP